jgi:2-amino-4-hydroxy-6-hydroxymethyldihydropteridine diphosphokinase
MNKNVFIGLGSNLGERQQHLAWAIDQLDQVEQVKVTRCSSIYETAPMGSTPEEKIEAQPDYLNAVCHLETALPAETILEILLDLEQRSGRVRTGVRNSPRTLDLDLLLYGDKVINTANLCVPHPRMHNRAFVLYPLMEIAPQQVIPGIGQVDTLIKKVETQGIRKITDQISLTN